MTAYYMIRLIESAIIGYFGMPRFTPVSGLLPDWFVVATSDRRITVENTSRVAWTLYVVGDDVWEIVDTRGEHVAVGCSTEEAVELLKDSLGARH